MKENLTLTDDDYEQMALGLQAGEREAFLEFDLHFTPRFEKKAEWEGLSITNQEAFAVTCCFEIPRSVQDYFNLKHKENTDEKFFARWVFWKAKHIRLRLHSAVKRLEAGALPTDEVPEAGTEPNQRAKAQKERTAESRVWPEYEHLERAEFWDALGEALQSLSVIQREVFTLRHLDGCWPFADIAKKLGIDESAARVYDHRARKALKKRLSHDPRWQSWLENHHK